MNKVFLSGNVGKDPQVKHLQTGLCVVEFSIATTEYRKVEGSQQQFTEWHNVTVFGKQAEKAANGLKKGSKVFVEGKMKTESWDKEGTKHYKTKVVAESVHFLGDEVSEKSEKSQDNSHFASTTQPIKKTIVEYSVSEQPSYTADDIPF